MPGKIQPVKSSFSAGEVTPKISARSDLTYYQQGMEEVTNMLPLRHGPLQRRQGMQYEQTYPGSTSAEMFTFHVSPSQSFVVSIIDDGLMRVNDEAGQVLTGNLVINPYFDFGLTNWTDGSQANAGVVWANGVAGFGSSQVDREARLGQSLNTSNDPNGNHEIHVTGEAGLGSVLTLKIGTGLDDDSIASFDITEDITSHVFNPGGLDAVWITFVFVGIAPLTGFWSLDAVTCGPTAAGPIEFAHPWGLDDISDIQAEMPPGEDVMFFTSPRVAPQELLYNSATGAWTFQAITFTSTPAVWTGINFPSCLTFFQGRSWWGGTPDQPATFWASKSSFIRNFTVEDPALPVADDGMEHELTRRGRIEWMEGVKNLLMGTEVGEFIVTAEAGIIEPGDIQVEQQSAYGSENAQALPIGNDVLYLSADGSKLRDLNYSWTEDGWISRDLTWPAEHFGLESPMRKVVYAKDPESILICLSASGQLFVCTYDGNSKDVGWARANTRGRIVAVTVTQTRGASVVWALVDRGIGEDEFFLEKFTGTASTNDFLDGYVVQVTELPTDQFTAAHLPDQIVSVSVDDATHRDVQLNNLGEGVLDFEGTRIVAGFKYSSKVRTMAFAFGDDQTGSMIGRVKRYNRLFVRVLNSAVPLINGQRPPERSPATPMGLTEPDDTIDLEVRQIGWDQEAKIEVEQDLPRALTILALVGEFDEGMLK